MTNPTNYNLSLSKKAQIYTQNQFIHLFCISIRQVCQMKGLFFSEARKIPICVINILSGTIIAVRFSLWGIEAVQDPDATVSTAIFCFLFFPTGQSLGGENLLQV